MKLVSYINMIGVLALATLCAWQWQANRRANLLAVSLDKTRQEQVQTMAEQGRSIKGYMSDLDQLRSRLDQSDKALREAEDKVVTLTSQRDTAQAQSKQACAELSKLKEVLDKWMAALKQRDESMTMANQEILRLARERNDATAKFNDLATKYNALVKDWNAAQGKTASAK